MIKSKRDFGVTISPTALYTSYIDVLNKRMFHLYTYRPAPKLRAGGFAKTDLNRQIASLAQDVLSLWDEFTKQLPKYKKELMEARELAINDADAAARSLGGVSIFSLNDPRLSKGYNAAMTDEDFKNDSYGLLKKTLLPQGAMLSDEIDKLERTSDDDKLYYGYIKHFFIGSGCLADDIVNAAHNDAVLLAAIGTRVLLEDEINALYLKSKSSRAERVVVAQDWLRVANDPAANKSKIDGKRIDQRAEIAGDHAKAIYAGEYAFFCNYSHGTAHRGLLNDGGFQKLGSKKSTLASLQAYWNILVTVGEIAGQELPDEAGELVGAYLDKYRTSVIEATLPLPQEGDISPQDQPD